MYKKLTCITIVLVVCLAGIAFAANIFTDEGADHLWNNPDNWSLGVVPQDETTHPRDADPQWNNDVHMSIDGTLCVIDDTHVGDAAATAYGTIPGSYGGDNTLHILGGELRCGGWGFNIGRGASDPSHEGGFGHVLMTGGVVTTPWLQVPEQWDNGNTQWPMQGELVMTGGIITTGWFVIADLWAIGHVDLHGGTIHSLGFLTIDPDGTLDITEGTLIVDGNSVDKFQGYIDSGWITAYGGTGELVLDYDQRNSGETTLTATTGREAYDLDESGSIGWGDLAIFRDNWLATDEDIDAGDFFANGIVDFCDYAKFVSFWEGAP